MFVTRTRYSVAFTSEGSIPSAQPNTRYLTRVLCSFVFHRKMGNKMGKWWKSYGYEGPDYCQRCSEVFRDHIMRGPGKNSAKCSIDYPCRDCASVLCCFPDRRKLLQKIMNNSRESEVKANASMNTLNNSTASSSSNRKQSDSERKSSARCALVTTVCLILQPKF